MRFYVVRNFKFNQLVPECLLTDLLAGWLPGEVRWEKMLRVLDKKVTFRTPSCKRKGWSTSQDKVDQTLVLPAKSFSLSSFTQRCPIISRELNLSHNFMAFFIMVRVQMLPPEGLQHALHLGPQGCSSEADRRFFNSFLATFSGSSSASKLSLSPPVFTGSFPSVVNLSAFWLTC